MGFLAWRAGFHSYLFDRSHAPAWERRLVALLRPGGWHGAGGDAGASYDVFPRWSVGTITTKHQPLTTNDCISP